MTERLHSDKAGVAAVSTWVVLRCGRTELGEYHYLVHEVCLDSAGFQLTALPERLSPSVNGFAEYFFYGPKKQDPNSEQVVNDPSDRQVIGHHSVTSGYISLFHVVKFTLRYGRFRITRVAAALSRRKTDLDQSRIQ